MEICDILRQSGYKITPQRQAVIEIINCSHEHLTAAELFEKVSSVRPDIGKVTVYRTLEVLTGLGLVCEVRNDKTTSYVISPPEHHDHLICSRCGKVVNFTRCNMAGLEKRLARETGFSINKHHLELYGECSDCRQNLPEPGGA